MEQKLFKKILIDFGYSDESVKKMMQGKMVPTLQKAIKLQEDHDIPVLAWKNIRSFAVRTKKDKSSMPDTPVHVQEQSENQLHQKEIA
ncbi:hypothetical protein [Sulfuricurvum sp.]|uniref:hypothetical protein n=1 Tax=Sulfuricurvum sp. TaxID=2025608 RepID=UPI002E3371FD|nr:hypothetical protein [Sulfuricurvum sp.]HEX5330810.1 hypothetical protein [Sulfuricurvum sp.]